MMGLDYRSGQAPPDYFCRGCRQHGCRLWVPFQGRLEEVLCQLCAERYTKKGVQGKVFRVRIGRMVPAVPVEEGEGFWTPAWTPPAGQAWWLNLPMAPPASPKAWTPSLGRATHL